ncbi:MAG: hypothetical protein U0556_18150 [Dehalococcoidia bacterium]
MAQKGALAVEPRTITGKKVKQLRREGKTPANIYGPGIASQAIQADTHDLALLLRDAEEGATVQIQLEKKSQRVRVQDVQWNPISGLPAHVDFYQADK